MINLQVKLSQCQDSFNKKKDIYYNIIIQKHNLSHKNMTITNLINLFKETRDDDIFNFIFYSNQKIIYKVIHSMKQMEECKMPFEECIECASVGLYDAVLKYDASFKSKFTTYAYYRIKGTIMDGYRKYSRYLAKASKETSFNENTVPSVDIDIDDKMHYEMLLSTIDKLWKYFTKSETAALKKYMYKDKKVFVDINRLLVFISHILYFLYGTVTLTL